MKKCLVISAHLDDAILSAGQFIVGRGGEVDVLTVFSGIPQVSADFVTGYDKSCGFDTSKDAMVIRRQEDREACAILNAHPHHMDFLDHQYETDDTRDLYLALHSWVKNRGYEMILAPLGLRHPNHIALSDTVSSLSLPNLYLYEDLPHRVTHPELVAERLKEFPGAELTFIGDGPIQDKVRALWCYRSQIGRGDLNPYNLYVPERFWKI